jgi:hypothetical protein
MAQSFKESKVARECQTVSLSKQTVTSRLEDISNQTSGSVKGIVTNCSYFSIALNDITDVSDTSQSLIFISAIK